MLDPKVIRRHILRMAYNSQSAHIGSSFSIVEILTVLLGECMNFYPSDPERDYLVLSKGHGAMTLYACLHEMGYIDQLDLSEYLKDGSKLHGEVEATMPGIDATTGSLGHGLPIAVGLALGLKRMGKTQRVYCVAGDGEMNEGSMWEALLFAAHHGLNNLTLIVDANGLQAMGKTSQIMNLEGLSDKLKAFNWDTTSCNGHSRTHLKHAFYFPSYTGPSAVIARTQKGHGVSFMEDDNTWHYKRLDEDTYQRACAEIDTPECGAV